MVEDGVEELVDGPADGGTPLGHLGEELGSEGVGVLDRPSDGASDLADLAGAGVDAGIDPDLEVAGPLLPDPRCQLGGHKTTLAD